MNNLNDTQLSNFKNRFWKKVNKDGPDGCWIWLAGRSRQGYGHIGIGKKTKRANRVSWELHYGKIPQGMFICHKCDNPSCVNPEHLFLGTAKDNTQDMLIKGRGVDNRGEKHGQAKFTEKQVLEIRAKYKTGKYTQQQLAKKYDTTQSTIWKIITKTAWRHI